MATAKNADEKNTAQRNVLLGKSEKMKLSTTWHHHYYLLKLLMVNMIENNEPIWWTDNDGEEHEVEVDGFDEAER